jgi:glycosyltransferase involved in cell wall biosynthesis
MKVIHFIASIDKNKGGTTEYIRLIASELKNHLEIIIATGISPNPTEISGVKINFFDTNILRWFSMLKEFRQFLVDEKPDIVHINGIWSPENYGFQKKAQELGIKVIVSPHGMLEPWILAHNPIKKRIGLLFYQKKIIQSASRIHATAQMEADNIIALGLSNSIVIVPNGIDLSEIKKTKEQYGNKKMVYLSRLHPKKGVELLLAAWRKSDTKGWTLEIAGTGEAYYIKTLIQSAKDLDNVRFVGALYGEDKWDFLRSADVMVLPTYSENFGIVIAEALAIGIPVITTKKTPWEDLETYDCGWWIDLSVANLENTLAKAFNTATEILEKMGNNGRKLVAEKYDIKTVAYLLYDTYKKCLIEKVESIKVLHIVNSIDKSTGGPARSVPQTCAELAGLGITIELITQESSDMIKVPERANLTVRFCSIWELFLYGSRLSSTEVDLIHLQHIWNPYIQVMAFWAHQKKIPYIITTRGMLEPWIMAHNSLKKKIGLFLYQKKAIQRAAHLHATAQMEANNIKKLGFNNPISIIPNGIDLSVINERKANYGTRKMVFLSRIHPKKGIELLLEAWSKSETEGWSLEIAGEGEANYMKRLISSVKDCKNIHFVGAKYDKDKWDFLRSADVMVLPTYSENFGNVVAEALIIGVPVITTKGTPWEDLETYKCGWWIDLSVENLEKTLVEAFNIPTDVLEVMGNQGRKLVAEKYELKAVAEKIVDLYEKVLNEK